MRRVTLFVNGSSKNGKVSFSSFLVSVAKLAMFTCLVMHNETHSFLYYLYYGCEYIMFNIPVHLFKENHTLNAVILAQSMAN